MEHTRNKSYNGNFKYEWEQSYDDLTLYFTIDSRTTKKDISVEFKPNYIRIIVNKEPLNMDLKGELYGTVNTSESFWLLQDSELEIHICKAISGEVWDYVITGDEPLSQISKEDEKRKLLLERFQREHPTFDFSDAHINGSVPEPRTFMK